MHIRRLTLRQWLLLNIIFMEDSGNNRKQLRAKVDLPARFGVLIPEDTFSPVYSDAVVSDLSERGAMVVTSLDEGSHKGLLHKIRYCRIEFKGVAELPNRLVGRAVWIQPAAYEEGARAYKVGVYFEDCLPEALAQVHEYLSKVSVELGAGSVG